MTEEAINCIDLINEFMDEPEENIKKIYKIHSPLARINVIVMVLLQLTCTEENSKKPKKDCEWILNFLRSIFESIQPWKDDEQKKTFYKKLISEMGLIIDSYYPEIKNKNDPILLSLIQEIYLESNKTYASLRNLPDYSAGTSKMDCLKSYLDKLRAQLQGTLNRIGIDDNLDRKKGISNLHARYLKELLESINTTSDEELLFESIRNCRFDKRKFNKLSHSIIMGADGGLYMLLNRISTEEYELLAESPDLNHSLELMIEETTRKIIIGEGSFGKIRIVMAIIPNEKQNNSLIEGKIVCVKKAGRKKKNKETEDIWNSTWNDYCSIEFLDDAPEIYDIKITKDSQNKLQGYCFQKLLMFPNGQKIFEDSKKENIQKFKEYHNWPHVKNYVLGILTLMIELHSKGICMTDLKPANTLYDKESKTTKLVDLAGAVRVKNKEELRACKIEYVKEYSPKYSAPELINEEEEDISTIDLPKCISWSVGNVLRLIINKIPKYEFEIIENDVASLIKDLTEENKDDRISIEEGLKRLLQIPDIENQESSKQNILFSYVDALKIRFRQEDKSVQTKMNLKNDVYDLCRVFNNKLKITSDNPDKYENYVYDPENDKTIKDLTEELKCMLNQRNEVEIPKKESIKKEALILFGSAGSGKSSALQKLFIEAVQEWKPGDAIPIFMNLAIDQDLKSYMSSLMNSLEIKNYHFESILSTPLNLFFDSLDESRIKDGPRFIQTLFKDLSSYKNKNYSIKMIVTCRTGYFDEECFEKEIKNDQINMKLRYIIPLDYFFFNDNTNLIELIELYLAKNGENIEEPGKIKEEVIRYMETIKEYDLNKLMKTTYMIFIILNILPQLEKQKNSPSIENNKINLLTIYRIYLMNNISKEIKRSSIEAIKKKSVELLIKVGTTLAEKMMETEKAANQLKGEDVFKFLLSPTLTQILGKEYQTKLGFIENKEIYEIMRTLNLNIHIEKKNEDEEITLFFPHDNIKNFFAVNGLVDRMKNSDDYPEWLESKLFVKDGNLVSFMIEAFKNEFKLAQKAEIAILASKGQSPDSKVSVRAANLITFLVASNYSFYGRDLSHINIKGANISDGIFNGCNLDYANLSEVALSNVKVDRASFHKTNFSQAKIDNFPPLNGHSNIVFSVAFSADGKKIVSGSRDKTIRIWDLKTGKELQKFEGHSYSVTSVAFSADEKRVVSGSEDKTVRVWEVETGKELQKYEGHSGFVNSVAFSADGKFIVSGSIDKTVRTWNVETGKEIGKCEGHSSFVNSVAFSVDGKRIVSGSDDKTVRIWDVEKGKELKKYAEHSGHVKSVAFSADEKRIVSGSTDTTVRIWDVETEKELKKYEGHSDSVTSVAFSADGKRIVSGSDDRTVRIWDVQTGKEIKKYEGHSDFVTSVAISADGKRIVSGSGDTKIGIWEVEAGKELKKYEGHSDYVNAVAFLADENKIVSGSKDKTVRIWDGETGKELKKYEGHSDYVSSVAFSADGKRIVSGSGDRTVRIWDVKTGRELKKYEGHSSYVTSVAVSSDGNIIASGSGDKSVRIWDGETGKEIQKFDGHSKFVNSVSISGDGKRIVSGSDDKTVRIWDIEIGKEFKKCVGHSDSVISVAFSADGKRIASGSDDTTVAIWDAETAKQVKKYEGHSDSVCAVAFSADGKRIVSGSRDKTIKIWDIETGKELKNYEGHSDYVTSIAFSADRKKIVSGSLDKTVRIWDLETGKGLKISEGNSNSVNSLGFSADGENLISAHDCDNFFELPIEKKGTCLVISSYSTPFSSLNLENFGTWLNCPYRLSLFLENFEGKN